MTAVTLVLVIGSLFGMLVGTLVTDGAMWTYFTRKRRLQRRYERAVWDRAESYIQIGASPESAYDRASADMHSEAVAALKVVP